MNGSYEALKGGATSEALSDFTSGVPESYDLGDYGTLSPKIPDNLFRTLKTSFERGAVGGASVEVSGAGIEADAGQGLIAGHAYTLSAAVQVHIYSFYWVPTVAKKASVSTFMSNLHLAPWSVR